MLAIIAHPELSEDFLPKEEARSFEPAAEELVKTAEMEHRKPLNTVRIEASVIKLHKDKEADKMFSIMILKLKVATALQISRLEQEQKRKSPVNYSSHPKRQRATVCH